ncbi:MAG: hypothetical protein RL295_1461, partial [Pseudomonadota bacterium]
MFFYRINAHYFSCNPGCQKEFVSF